MQPQPNATNATMTGAGNATNTTTGGGEEVLEGIFRGVG